MLSQTPYTMPHYAFVILIVHNTFSLDFLRNSQVMNSSSLTDIINILYHSHQIQESFRWWKGFKRRARSHGGRSRRRGFMEDIDDLVLAGHGGIVHHADVDVDPPDEKRRQALEARLKCEVIRIAEEAARGSGCRISPQVAQCLTELTMSYADQLADDLSAFAQHRKGKTVTHEDVLLAVRRIPAVRDSVQALLPSEKRKRQTTFNVS